MSSFNRDKTVGAHAWLLNCTECRGDDAQYKDSVGVPVPVKWAAVGEACVSVWNWQYDKEWAGDSANWYNAVGGG